MAEIDKKMIQYLARLSRIACPDEEQEALLNDLRKIVGYIEALQQVPTENVPPCSHVLENMYNVLRDDVIGDVLPRSVFLDNAPSHVGGMIRVPPVLKSQS